MRLLLHDFAGHAFPVSLSRELALRGHTVCHAYCASLVTTPQGVLSRRAGDPIGLGFAPIDLGASLNKGAFIRRWRQERRHGVLAAELVERFQPDVVLSGNTPLDAQRHLMRASQNHGARFVFWVQDLIGVAASRLLREKLPLFGGLIGDYYAMIEGRQLARSDALVLITDDFRYVVPAIEQHPDAHVIPNWAPLDELPMMPRDNDWAREQGLTERTRFVYSGTLGMKHNPRLLTALARENPGADVIVVTQGAGADWLKEHGSDLPNLRLLPFQPFERLPEVLGAADVLVAILEPDASIFSVPSKVLSYLCAGRAILLGVPPQNLVARIVAENQAGEVALPHDERAFLDAASKLGADPEYCSACAGNARAYAEENFDVSRIADQFERILAPSP